MWIKMAGIVGRGGLPAGSHIPQSSDSDVEIFQLARRKRGSDYSTIYGQLCFKRKYISTKVHIDF